MTDCKRFLYILACGISFLIVPIACADLPPPVPVVEVEAETLPLPAPVSPDVPIKENPTQDFIVLEPAPEEASVPAPQPAPTIVEVAPTQTDIPITQTVNIVEEHIPIPKRKAQKPPDVPSALMVMELFSTQACIFCPKADAMMKGFIDHPDLIALSCHVDYFDVKEGSRALPFCSSRQSAYEKSLDQGPKYTPQIVVNGKYDAIGYKPEQVKQVLEKAAQDDIKKVRIKPLEHGLFMLDIPAGEMQSGPNEIWLMVFDQPQDIKVADGGNAGKDMTYYNVVSKVGLLGRWEGDSQNIKFDAKMSDQSKGFAVIVQNVESRNILMAGKYTQ